MNNKRVGFVSFVNLCLVLIFLPIVIIAQGVEFVPVAVSPGSDTSITSVAQGCPTFSWSSVAGAASYRLVVFVATNELLPYDEMAYQSQPLVQEDIIGPALTWTLPYEQSLKSGRIYVWYVQALDDTGIALSDWSIGKMFKIEQPIGLTGLTGKLAQILKSHGVSDTVISSSMQDLEQVFSVTSGSTFAGMESEQRDSTKGSELTNNTFYGLDAGDSTTGIHNSFFGYRAGRVNSIGTRNNFFGDSAGYSNTEGNDNIFVGYRSGYLNSTGDSNVFIGNSAGYDNTIGNENTITGNSAGANNTTGNYNCFYGYRAGFSNTSASNNVFIGFEAGYYNIDGTYNCFVGKKAGYNNNTGNSNSFFGNDAGYTNASGSQNTYFGAAAGYSNQSGIGNTFLGTQAGYLNSSGSNNVFLGYRAGYNELTSNKLYIANSDTASPLVYGEFDNSILAINGKLGINTKTPAYNIEVDTTGSNACIVVKRTDGASNYINATATHANFGSVTNHPLRLMVNSTARMVINTDNSVTLTSGASCTSGGVWTNASSRVLKENIHALDTTSALSALKQLEPVIYNYKSDKMEQYVGFIAEDVPSLVATNDRKGLSPMDIAAVLTKVVQEQQRVNQEQQQLLQQRQQVIATLLKENEDYQKIIADIQKRIKKLEKR